MSCHPALRARLSTAKASSSVAVVLGALLAALLPAATAAAPAPPAAPVVAVSSGGVAIVVARCPAVAARCAGTVQLRTTVSRPQRLGVARFGSTGRRLVGVGVRLNDVAVSRLARAGSLRVEAVVTTRVGRRVRVAARGLLLRKPPAPPAPTVVSATTPASSASFILRSIRGASFRCSLDGGPWVRCANPAVFTGLGDGEHVLRVRASHRVRGLSAVTTTTWHTAGPTPVTPPPAAAPLLPDLMAGIRNFGIRTVDLDGSEYDGEKGLFFATDVINVGNGPLEIRTNPTSCQSSDGPGRVATQRVFRDGDGNGIFNRPADEAGASDSVIGCVAYHEAHRHTHFQEFGIYELFHYSDGARGARVSMSDKVSYCMIDDLHYENFSSLAEPEDAFYPYEQVCQGTDDSIMGVSVGWTDRYGSDRPDQFVPLGTVPDGTYCLQVKTDYLNRLEETNDANNNASVVVEIAGTSVSPTAAVTVNQLRC